MFIWQHSEWPHFEWNLSVLAKSLKQIYRSSGRLEGRMEGIAHHFRDETRLRSLTNEVIHSNLIEGERLDPSATRSSAASRLGMDIGALPTTDRRIDAIVDMVLDATQNYDKPLTGERLRRWHASLFPSGFEGFVNVRSGEYRRDETGPMQVVSGPLGREKVHYEAPPAENILREMDRFLVWFESESEMDAFIKAGMAHLWFLTIHPFEDGNGRIGRAILEMGLARADESGIRYYSMSRQIEVERRAYYRALESTQKGSLEISDYLTWYMGCLMRAIDSAVLVINDVLHKSSFWNERQAQTLNERQVEMINRLLDGFKGKLTTTKWAKITGVSHDTAGRDIQDLIERSILAKGSAGGRSTSYLLVETVEKVKDDD